jgi:hypothetical protein
MLERLCRVKYPYLKLDWKIEIEVLADGGLEDGFRLYLYFLRPIPQPSKSNWKLSKTLQCLVPVSGGRGEW